MAAADGRAERFPALVAELVRLPVDVIVTRGTPAALAAKQATATERAAAAEIQCRQEGLRFQQAAVV
jgi:hypothetical protein